MTGALSFPNADRRIVETPAGMRLAGCAVGSGPTVVFGNSLAADAGMWTEVARALDGRVRAIFHDAAGHGASSAQAGPLTVETMAEHALHVADAFGARRFVFCGLSLGGLVGMHLAAHRPDRIQGLMLANTATAFPPAAMWADRAETAEAEGMEPIAEASMERWLTPAFREARPERAAALRVMIEGTSPRGYAAACRLLAEADLSEALPRIACPTVVTTGRNDPSTPPAAAEALAATIAQSDLVLTDAAHLSAVEAPDTFANAILRLTGRQTRREVA